MKATRISFMVVGIVLLMFVITPYVSAAAIEGVWFKGKASIKGYEIDDNGPTDPGVIMGKAGGSATIYVNIIDGASLDPPDLTHYFVTTCIENPDVKDEWILGDEVDIWKGHIYGDINTVSIWDFAVGSDPGMNFDPNINTYPIFYVKMNGGLTKADFKSFACTVWDKSDPDTTIFQLGSCSISFKTIDSLKVPRGANGCILQ